MSAGQLVDIAAQTTRRLKVTVRYLGALVGANQFERDFTKSASAQPKQDTASGQDVWFEFEHVQERLGGVLLPYRIKIKAEKAAQHGLPENVHPLAASAPAGLVFDMKFFEALATNVADGATYKGVCYDGERSEIVQLMPNNGD